MNYLEEKAHGIYVFCVTGILLCLLSIFALQRQYVLNLIVTNIGLEREKYFGDLIFDLYQKELKIVDNQKAAQELQKLTALLYRNNDFANLNLRFHIVDDDTVNAAAMMGGHIIVNKGLVIKSKNGEQLLAVLAHEIAHVKNRDVLKSVFAQIGVSGFLALLFGDASAIINNLAMTSSELINLKFSREVEMRADEGAVDILSNAGIACRGLIDFFEDNDKRRGGAVFSSKAEILMTHPVGVKRIKAIKNYISKMACDKYNLPAVDVTYLQSLL